MVHHRESESRGLAEIGWLKSYHTFSFSEYYDPKYMGFSVLRVINEDFIAPAAGFPTHGHKDMEIITYMVEGVLEHKDTMGNSKLLHAGEVQRMSAGTGVRHSEFNHKKDEPVHLLQIWIIPDKVGIEPSYEQRSFDKDLSSGDLQLIVSPNGENGSLKVNQDIKLYASKKNSEVQLNQDLNSRRRYYLQVINGNPIANGAHLKAGDGLALQNENQLNLTSNEGCEFLLFDLP